MLRLPQEWVSRLRPRFEGRRVCVTGGAGFIGGHLVDALLSLGASIAVVDDLSNSSSEHLGTLIDMDPERVRFVHGSILDESAIADACEKADAVFHLAAMSSVPRSVADPERSYAVNATGTMRVAEAARRAGVKRVVYSASSSAYGASERLPKVETDVPEPVSPYAGSKLAGEHIMQAWSHSYGLSTVSLRYFNIFGPRQPADSPYSGVIAVFAKKLLSGQAPTIFGDGLQSRDFTYVSNAVLANLLAASSDRAFMGEVVNIGAGEKTDLVQLARIMAEACGSPHLKPVFQPARAGDVKHSLADLAKARHLLGYAPIVGLADGLGQTVDWYRTVYGDQRPVGEP
ncbi:MAG: NAD-dependent epimerase/dehydratase family protein [Phycisphaerales bacterium]|nr:NAD-dependent epimerase/dehydratase family protein [Phycisphaerales bacterium]